MPTLNWIGKEAVVDHHLRVPTRLLECDRDLSIGDPDAENLLVEGDNLEALKALLPRYRGQVKCIYIDPPYNTGNENWVYNDNVNDPRIRKWLGEVVGREAEDLCRHDKWLCMMYPRLALLRDFLREDGSIFVSIDDTEVGNCRLIMDEIFGARNLASNLVWHKRVSPANDAKLFSTDHDHILVYAKDLKKWAPHRLAHSEEQKGYYSNPDKDPRGPWNSGAYTCAKTADERPNLFYPITNPNTGEEVLPSRKRVWAYDADAHARNVENKLVWWGKTGHATKPRIKKFLSTARPVVPRSIWSHKEAGHNQEAKLESLALLPDNVHFATPKPVRLIRRVLEVASDPDSIILDSFAGSGTTGQAVLQANISDGGSRRCVLVELDPSIAQRVTSQRLSRAIDRLCDVESESGGGGNLAE
jgi:site-specific DNA-methyltransferase (adenine-specific)/adenine-specific DNA-methyltransferase